MSDASESGRAETGHREERRSSATILEHATVGIGMVDPTGCCVQFNRELADILGYTREELRALRFQDFIDPAHLGAIRSCLQQLSSGDDTTCRALATRCIRKDQSLLLVDLTLSLARTPLGAPDYFIFVMERTAEQGDAPELFRILADAIPQLCWMADPDGYIVWYNRRWLEYTGRSLEQMRGRKWAPVLEAGRQPEIVERWLQSVATGRPFQMEFAIRGLDGALRPFLTRVEPVRGRSGEVARWFGTCTDLSDLKGAEVALREAARRKDEFLATLSHELRNGLAPIRNALTVFELALDRELREKSLVLLQRQLEHVVRLVDDLLDLSRICAGKLALRRKWMPLQAAVSTAVETSRVVIEQMGHTLVVAMPDEPITLLGDATRLAQVISNLLINSAKYTERGGHIWLTVARQDDGVLVSVRDDGIGIDEDQLPELFRMFSQGTQSPVAPFGGLGVGLTVAKQLVEMHGGCIEARSAGLGKGSEFIVRLPLQAGS